MTRSTPFLRHAAAATVASLMLCGTVSAQPESLAATVLIQGGTPGITLNQPLIEALLNESRPSQALDQLFHSGGWELNISMPAKHPVGTYQVLIEMSVIAKGAWNDKRRDASLEVVTSHLRNRLDDLLYLEPKHRLEQRREDLSSQHALAHAQLEELRQRSQQSQGERKRIEQVCQQLDSQLRALELQMHTGGQAMEFLQHTHERQAALQKKRRMQLAAAESKVASFEAELEQLRMRAKAASGDSAKAELQAQVLTLTSVRQEVRSQVEALRSELSDARKQMSTVLEKVPQTEMELQTTRAQLSAVKKRFANSESRRSKLDDQHGHENDIQIQQLKMQSENTYRILTEIDGEIRRLQPVRYEVLGRR